MKVPINTPINEAGAKRIAKQEASWTAPKLLGIGVTTLAAALFLLVVVSQCHLAPLPVP